MGGSEFVNDVPSWKTRLVAENTSRDRLIEIVAVAPAHFPQSIAARILLDELDRFIATPSPSPQNNHRPYRDENWYKKPRGIIFLGAIGATVSLLIRAVLVHCFPQWFK